ncbi:MAG TPA: sodium:solute symporter family protein [bacterium]|nr:sodium:solute symporter family protein [bacterium]HPN43069.1 sodium:solute symporter family protein [bacterium]
MTLPDLSIIIGYIITIFILGFKNSKKIKNTGNASEFLLGGRQLTLPAFVATLVTTWYGGILGVGEFSYRFGISNWLVFGVPYYFSALIFAFVIAQKAQQQTLYTIPQQLERVYGRRASLFGALFVFIYATPAPYLLMLGIVIQYFFHIPLVLSIIIGAIFSTCYVYSGGFRSVVRTDIVQFLFMYAGFIIILLYCTKQFGGWQFLRQHLPAGHFSWHGGQGAGYIIMWFFISLSTLTEPAFYQRCFAAQTPQIARRGIIISVLFWLAFDFMTTFTGLYARALLPNLANPVTGYLDLAQLVLPPIVLGLFFTGLIATIMSTVDSYMFIAGITIGRDCLWRLRNNKDEGLIPYYTRIGLLAAAITGIIIAVYGQSVVNIWKELGSISTPALLVPVVSSFSSKWQMDRRLVTVTICSGAAVSFLWSLTRYLQACQNHYFLHLEPIYPGLLVTITMYLFDKLFISGKHKVKTNTGS